MQKGILGTGTVLLLVIMFTGLLLITGGGPGTGACAAIAANPQGAAERSAVAGYQGDQLVNAALIMNAGATAGVNVQGQTIAVMTAMGESTLRNLTYGDAVGPDSRGLFQQRDTWGTLAERMNPTQAATFFFQRLVTVPNWETLTPTAAAHAVQINADPDHYTTYYDAARAVVTALTTGDAACAAGVSGDARALAAALVVKIDAGTITGLSPDHLREIRWIADGETRPNCGIDTRILQVITIATNMFERVGISDINRACTGQVLGSGLSSPHSANGGGHAVDFYSFDRMPTTGADANALKLLKALSPVMPAGSGAGQNQCRADTGVSLDLSMKQFRDDCNHVHIAVDPTSTDPLKLSN
ncbi:hypothetical protein RCH16_003461 [Cryobacterium sp. MP_M5]|uniref:hypothetical protein n=1 Tax=unclassified Cryobacterium TaxID=2649013 RepID=UPI0018C98A75|nr:MULTISPECIES: hypothetical protein [unclassified Cryobacterium]MBG6060004.1 hypothetical protein [Cryobacterium sp. MP_M3]MEC5178422.1 hypothetical protein [Cryobacterium sp. MP_M5]